MMRFISGIILPALLILATAAPSWGQQQGPQPPPGAAQTGPLVVERVEHGWLVAPDARAADFNGRVGGLAGAYVGHLTDRTWLVGGGGYWLTNREDDFTVGYGGAVVEWLARTDRRIGFGVRTLIGAGSATMSRTVGDLLGDRVSDLDERSARFGTRRGTDTSARVRVRDHFFIAEPQANLLLNITRKYRFNVGVGYRVIGAAPLLGDELRGVSGSVAFQIGGGF